MRRCYTLIFLVSGAMVATGLRAAEPLSDGADLVLLNGKIWTVNKAEPEVEALAIWRDRIFSVGRSAQMRALMAPRTRTIDLKGRRVVPGFYDSHIHLLGSGQRLSEVALKDAANGVEFGRRLQQFDRKLPRDRWLLGGEWDHDRTFHGQLPSAELLDKYVRDRPVFLRRYDGHMAVVNSHVLHAGHSLASCLLQSGTHVLGNFRIRRRGDKPGDQIHGVVPQ